MIAFIDIARRRPCHSPSHQREGELYTDSGRNAALRRPQILYKYDHRYFQAGSEAGLRLSDSDAALSAISGRDAALRRPDGAARRPFLSRPAQSNCIVPADYFPLTAGRFEV